MVQVRTRPLRSVLPSPAGTSFQRATSQSGAFDRGGAGLVAAGQGLSQAAEAGFAIALQIQKDDNEAEAKEADTGIAERIRELTYGNNGYFSQQGKNAIEQYEPTRQNLIKQIEEVSAGASNSQVRRRIEEMGAARLNRTLATMDRHALTQREAYIDATSKAREGQAFTDATLQWNDPAIIERSLAIVTDEVLLRAERQGLSDEATVTLLDERRAVIVKGVFDAALASQDIGTATQLFSRYAENIDGATRLIMAESLASDTQSAKAQTLAARAIEQFPEDVQAQREYIREVSNGKVEDAAIAELNSRIEEVRADVRFGETLRAAQQKALQDRLPTIAQGIVDETEILFPNNPRLARQDIRNKYDGDVEDEAIAEYNRRLAERRTDASSEATTLARDYDGEAFQLMKDARDNFPNDLDGQREFIDSSGADSRVVELAFAKLDRRIQAQRGDISTERANRAEQRALDAEARTIVNHEHTKNERNKKQEIEDARSFAYTALYNGQTVEQIRKDSPTVFQTLAANNDVEQLTRVQANIAENKVFAIATDGRTLADYTGATLEERASVNPVQFRHKLTRTEYNQAVRAHAAAKKEMEGLQENTALFNSARTSLQRFLPVGFDPKKSEKDRKAFDQMYTQMSVWVNERISTGDKPNVSEIEAEAARISMQVEADTSALPFTGFSGFASQAGDMTAEERAVATVDFDDIPTLIRNRIESILFARGVLEVGNDVMENLAGALAMQDQARFTTIVRDLEATVNRAR